jgi:DNA-binding SARP family transcriptional activator
MIEKTPGDHLDIRLLGGFAVTNAGSKDCTPKGKKLRALIAYLAMAPASGWQRERLMTLLWGDRDEAQARICFRQALAGLRRVLANPTILHADRDTVAFDRAAVTVDAVEFQRSCKEGRFEQAAELYQGVFLDGLAVKSESFMDWLLIERTRLHDLAVVALAALLKSQTEDVAIKTALRLLELDPVREETHRSLMRLYMLKGERAQALRQYHACRKILEQELGIRPVAETERLFREIRSSGRVLRTQGSRRAARSSR